MKKLFLHQKIKTLRLQRNYTQLYMADELNIDVTNYSRIERGKTNISVQRLKKIATILEVDISFLINSNENFSVKNTSETELLQSILNELRQIKNLIEKV